jgi:hypothetical protein
MSVMNVLDRTGDTRIEWDPAAISEVKIAKKAFDEAKKKKYLTYKLDAHGNRSAMLNSGSV